LKSEFSATFHGGPVWNQSLARGNNHANAHIVRQLEIGMLVTAIEKGSIRITDHALDEAKADGIVIPRVLDGTAVAEIIERYPDDRPYSSCLVYGECDGPLHTVWAYNEADGWAVLITIYRPDPRRWINWRTRRSRS